jgi:hypothetical protein
MPEWIAETGPASLDNYHATDFRLTLSTSQMDRVSIDPTKRLRYFLTHDY